MDSVRKYSRKREALLEALRGTAAHPSAETLFRQLRDRYPDLSLGTVYRNLAQLREDGTVISVGTVAGQERYDGRTDPHAHFICTVCGAVRDVELTDATPDLCRRVEQVTGGRVDSQQVTFYGRCGGCAELN